MSQLKARESNPNPYNRLSSLLILHPTHNRRTERGTRDRPGAQASRLLPQVQHAETASGTLALQSFLTGNMSLPTLSQALDGIR